MFKFKLCSCLKRGRHGNILNSHFVHSLLKFNLCSTFLHAWCWSTMFGTTIVHQHHLLHLNLQLGRNCSGYPLCDRETVGNIWVKINIFPTKFPLIIFKLPTSYPFNNFYTYCTHFVNRLPIFCLYLHVFPSISQLCYQHFLFMPTFCQHNIFTTPHFKQLSSGKYVEKSAQTWNARSSTLFPHDCSP